jgi:hypothetical protein
MGRWRPCAREVVRVFRSYGRSFNDLLQPVFRYSRQHLRCPAFEETNAWTVWLLQRGRIGPRLAVCATGDAVPFAPARYRNELSAGFELYAYFAKTGQ